MGRAIDLLESHLLQIVNDGEKFIDEGFMMGIFDDIAEDNKMFAEYKDYMFEKKLQPTTTRAGSDAKKIRGGKGDCVRFGAS